MSQFLFHKYQGTGNDFIIADNRSGRYQLSDEQVKQLCDRRFGIGSDGLILIEKDGESDFYMNFFNPDASKSFCGNGSRCAVMFASKLGIGGSHFVFRAIDGLHKAELDGDEVRIHMRNVTQWLHDGDEFNIHTGSPHLIRYTPEVAALDVKTLGAGIRYSEVYKAEGINVNFVEETPEGIFMRTYERGVEDETLSCGTGVTAAALSFALRHPGATDVNVLTRGGHLKVRWKRTVVGFEDVWLCGPAVAVFDGNIQLG